VCSQGIRIQNVSLLTENQTGVNCQECTTILEVNRVNDSNGVDSYRRT
jgi:hypothetical protein